MNRKTVIEARSVLCTKQHYCKSLTEESVERLAFGAFRGVFAASVLAEMSFGLHMHLSWWKQGSRCDGLHGFEHPPIKTQFCWTTQCPPAQLFKNLFTFFLFFNIFIYSDSSRKSTFYKPIFPPSVSTARRLWKSLLQNGQRAHWWQTHPCGLQSVGCKDQMERDR